MFALPHPPPPPQHAVHGLFVVYLLRIVIGCKRVVCYYVLYICIIIIINRYTVYRAESTRLQKAFTRTSFRALDR